MLRLMDEWLMDAVGGGRRTEDDAEGWVVNGAGR